MCDITGEQEELLEKLLEKLIRCEAQGEPAGSYINRMRHPQLNSEDEYGFTGERFGTSLEYQKCESLLKGLESNGLIEPHFFDFSHERSFPYGNLTSEGRCFFERRRLLAKKARREKWGERMWQVFIAVLGVVLSVIASIVTVNIKLNQ